MLHHLFRVTAPGGRLLLYVPAFPVLFSSMDRRVGHKRRYHRRELLNRTETAGFAVDRCVYADSLGFFAALIYARLVWHSSGILSPAAVRRYDRLVFPISRALDTWLHSSFGKNIVLTARRLDTD